MTAESPLFRTKDSFPKVEEGIDRQGKHSFKEIDTLFLFAFENQRL
jgi:hypothetical protein